MQVGHVGMVWRPAFTGGATVNEVEKRKPYFVEHDSVRVELADGQRWAFPLPWLAIRCKFVAGVATSPYRVIRYNESTDDLLAMLADVDGFPETASVVATLAGIMLRMNYDLVDEELDQVLAYRVDDTTSAAWVGTVVDIATGRRGRRRGIGVSDA